MHALNSTSPIQDPRDYVSKSLSIYTYNATLTTQLTIIDTENDEDVCLELDYDGRAKLIAELQAAQAQEDSRR